MRAKISLNCKSLILSPILSVDYSCLEINKYCLTIAKIEIGSLTQELDQFCKRSISL